MATFAPGTTVGPQPRSTRSTPGKPGRAADRQVFASLSYLTDRQVVAIRMSSGQVSSCQRADTRASPFGVDDTIPTSLVYDAELSKKTIPASSVGSESQPSAPGLLLPPPPMGP